MRTNECWVGLLSAALAAAGIVAGSGCDLLKKKKADESAAETVTAEPEPAPVATSTAAETATATATATADASTDASTEAGAGGATGDDEVKTYPNQIPASGTYVLLKSFNVYQAADIESKKLGGVGRGTIIELKATLGEWMLIDWPAGPGEMKPGWIKVRLNQYDSIKKDTEPKKDAGAPPPVVDAGARPKRGPHGTVPLKIKKPK